jgi:hypothetical protein
VLLIDVRVVDVLLVDVVPPGLTWTGSGAPETVLAILVTPGFPAPELLWPLLLPPGGRGDGDGILTLVAGLSAGDGVSVPGGEDWGAYGEGVASVICVIAAGTPDERVTLEVMRSPVVAPSAARRATPLTAGVTPGPTWCRGSWGRLPRLRCRSSWCLW